MPNTFTRSTFRQDVQDLLHGTMDTSGTTIQDRVLNRAVREVIADKDIDLRSTLRSMPLTLAGKNDIVTESVSGIYETAVLADILDESEMYEFAAPRDLKKNKIADVRLRTNRAIEYELVNPEQFDLWKTIRNDIIAVKHESGNQKLLVTGVTTPTWKMIHNLDTYNGNGTWSAVSDATAVATATSNYVEGAGAVSFTSGLGGTASGIVNSTMTAVDLTTYQNEDLFLWVYIPNITGLTNFVLRWGSDASNYYERTVTMTAEELSFAVGWNLLKFNWASATTTGSPTITAISYVYFSMTKATDKASVAGWIVDRLVAQVNTGADVLYYSKFGWQTSAGLWQETSTADADLLVADVDEYDLYVYKAAFLCSLNLQSQADTQIYLDMYNRKKEEYMYSSPSQAKTMSTSYHVFEDGAVQYSPTNSTNTT